MDLRSGKILGFEVLARWRHPLAGIIPPDRLIPIAEEIEVIDRLSEQVIRSALLASRGLGPLDQGLGRLSPSQFSDGWLAEQIVRILTETSASQRNG